MKLIIVHNLLKDHPYYKFIIFSTHSLCCCSISEPVVAHILQDLVAVVVLISAGVLVGPLDGEDGSLVVVQAADVVATSVVVL